MKKFSILSSLLLVLALHGNAQDSESPFVNYDQFEALVKEVKEHRKDRLLSVEEFNAKSKERNVFILDTRSKEMYDLKHVKGAVHLNFSDFTQENLDNLFGSRDVTILIYCNNNFIEPEPLTELDIRAFATKMSMPEPIRIIEPIQEINLEDRGSIAPAQDADSDDRGSIQVEETAEQPITLALNIPTYINLYGYGYKNVYELKELVDILDGRMEFEGTAISN